MIVILAFNALSLKLAETFQRKKVCLKMRLSIAKIVSYSDYLDMLFIISSKYEEGLSQMKSLLMFRLALYQVIKKRTWSNDDITRVFESCEVIPKVSQTKFHQNWTTKSRAIHIRISVLKPYQMMMSSVAKVKLIKAMVVFNYHTKGVSNHFSSDSDHEIKCSKTKKWKKHF